MRPLRRIQLIGLLAALTVSAAGCFRPAGEAIEATADSPTIDTANPTAIPPIDIQPDAGGESDDTSITDPLDLTATANALLFLNVTPDVVIDVTAVPVNPTGAPDDATATPEMEVLTIETIVAETAAAGGMSAGNPTPTPLPDLPDTNGNALTPQVITATAVYITPNAPDAPVVVPTSIVLPTDESSGLSDGGASSGSNDSSDEPQPGSIQTSSDGCFYIVEAGDSLYAIAISNGISLDELRQANSDVDPQSLQIGQRLRLPTCDVQPPTATTSALNPNATARATEEGAPEPTATPLTEGVAYRVQSGDTLYAIALRFNVTVNAIVRANAALQANPNLLRIGQELIIPVPVTPTSPPATPTRAATLPASSPIQPVTGATATAGG